MSKAIKIVGNTAHEKLVAQLNSFKRLWRAKMVLYGLGGIGVALIGGMLVHAAQNAMQAEANSAMAVAWWGIVCGGVGVGTLIAFLSVLVLSDARTQQKTRLQKQMNDLLARDSSLCEIFEQIDRQLSAAPHAWIEHVSRVLQSYEVVLTKVAVEGDLNSQHATRSVKSISI